MLDWRNVTTCLCADSACTERMQTHNITFHCLRDMLLLISLAKGKFYSWKWMIFHSEWACLFWMRCLYGAFFNWFGDINPFWLEYLAPATRWSQRVAWTTWWLYCHYHRTDVISLKSVWHQKGLLSELRILIIHFLKGRAGESSGGWALITDVPETGIRVQDRGTKEIGGWVKLKK